MFLAIAALGVVLPVLPTTPFLLLSAWFFARSSKKWHQWLLNNKVFGPMITNWETNRCVSKRTKVVAIVSMMAVGGSSVVFGVDSTWVRLTAVALLMVGCVVVLSLKTCPHAAKPDAH